MHDQRAKRAAAPASDHGRAAPGRGHLDDIGVEPVEQRVQRRFVIEIAVAAIDGQRRSGYRHDPACGGMAYRRFTLARRDDDHFLAAWPCSLQFAFDISFYTAARGGVKGADIY